LAARTHLFAANLDVKRQSRTVTLRQRQQRVFSPPTRCYAASNVGSRTGPKTLMWRSSASSKCTDVQSCRTAFKQDLRHPEVDMTLNLAPFLSTYSLVFAKHFDLSSLPNSGAYYGTKRCPTKRVSNIPPLWQRAAT
jgi:hypothetical protein